MPNPESARWLLLIPVALVALRVTSAVLLRRFVPARAPKTAGEHREEAARLIRRGDRARFHSEAASAYSGAIAHQHAAEELERAVSS